MSSKMGDEFFCLFFSYIYEIEKSLLNSLLVTKFSYSQNLSFSYEIEKSLLNLSSSRQDKAANIRKLLSERHKADSDSDSGDLRENL